MTNQPPLQCFVERRDGGGNYATLSDTGYGLAYIDRDVADGTNYQYRVTALDTNFNRFTSQTPVVTPVPTAT